MIINRPVYRTVLAVDVESSTTRNNLVKGLLRHCMPGALPVAVHREPDGRRVIVTALLRLVEAPQEPVLCPDAVQA